MNAALLFVLILFQQGLWVAGSDVQFELATADGQGVREGLVAQWVLSMNKTVVASGTQPVDPKTGKALVKLKAPSPRASIALKLDYRIRAVGDDKAEKTSLAQGSATVWVAPEPDLEVAGQRLPERSVITVSSDPGLNKWLAGKSVPAIALSQMKADDKPRVVIARACDINKQTGEKLLAAADGGAMVLVYGQPTSESGELLGMPLAAPGKNPRIASSGPFFLDIAPAQLTSTFEKALLSLQTSQDEHALCLAKPIGKGWLCIALSTQDDMKQHPVLQTLVKNTLSLAVDSRPLQATSVPTPERSTP
jgi:hypothetical protein